MRLIPRQELIRHKARRRELVVTDAEQLPGSFVRLMLGGDLAGFSSPGPADHAKLIIGGGVGRFYTPIPMGDSVAVDIFLHPNGPLACWASALPVDDDVILAGPRGSKLVPTDMTHLVAIADCSAFPAAARWIKETDVPIDLIAVGPGLPYLGSLLDSDRIRVQQLPEDRSGAAILASLQSIEPRNGTFVWAAGEATSLIPARRYLRNESGLDRQSIAMQGYWKFGRADHDHHAPIDERDPDD
ncbi:MAG: SIP domain-containing protein [Flaviflexus sp.]|nr:SIP domain-containing protein [Flaviflexus sp.]